jgi:tetratricopeptide (TPR) repeat protein
MTEWIRKTATVSSIVLFVCALCLADDPKEQAPITGTSSVDSPSRPAASSLLDGDSIPSAEDIRSLRNQLRLLRVSSISLMPDPNTTVDLTEYVSQLNKLDLPGSAAPSENPEPADTKNTASAPPNTASATDNNTQSASAADTQRSEPNAVQSAGKTTTAMPDRIAAMLAEPEKIVDPLGVGDALYAAKKYSAAAGFYQVAVDRAAAQKQPLNKAWALFQLANSLRFDDPANAVAAYEQLISEFPNSIWTPAAAAEKTIALWSIKNKPAQMMEKYSIGPNSL